jgi:hypothetical protein
MVSVEGKKPGELDSYLFNNHKIHTTTIEWENIKGVRITPMFTPPLKTSMSLLKASPTLPKHSC